MSATSPPLSYSSAARDDATAGAAWARFRLVRAAAADDDVAEAGSDDEEDEDDAKDDDDDDDDDEADDEADGGGAKEAGCFDRSTSTSVLTGSQSSRPGEGAHGGGGCGQRKVK
jgi:cobalamin biosynthesis protein CobT